MQEYDPITLGVLWSRLISTVDEAAASLQRTAFSTVAAESNDLACSLFDSEGNQLAQSSVSVPSFLGTLPLTVRHLLSAYPAGALEDGDILATNDPWLGTGHLPDITLVRPIFREGMLIGFAGSVSHLPDIGGKGMLLSGTQQMYEEGLRIPILKLYQRGQPKEDIFNIIASNVRVPEEVIGDIRAQAVANETAARSLLSMMDEYGIDDLSPLTNTILQVSEDRMRQAIAQVPDGVYRSHLPVDLLDQVIELHATMRVEGTNIVVDYEASPPKSDGSLNVPFNYTRAYTVYPIKCALDPHSPNNSGSLRPIKVVAPEGSLLNSKPPAAVNLRHLTGLNLPTVVLGCLAQAIPGKVIAPAGIGYIVTARGLREDGTPFAQVLFFKGGWGARQGLDGISCMAWPSNSSNTPVEIVEAGLPILIERKELVQDSGGAGQYRGGCGQRATLRSLGSSPIVVGISYSMVQHPPEGLAGGLPGKGGAVRADCEETLPGVFELAPGQSVTIEVPGAGGFGEPFNRNRTCVMEDVRNEVVSVSSAKSQYAMRMQHGRAEADRHVAHV